MFEQVCLRPSRGPGVGAKPRGIIHETLAEKLREGAWCSDIDLTFDFEFERFQLPSFAHLF